MYEMGLNQVHLSNLIGVSPSRVSEYLSGKSEPPLKVAREISKKLNISPSVVLGVKNPHFYLLYYALFQINFPYLQKLFSYCVFNVLVIDYIGIIW